MSILNSVNSASGASAYADAMQTISRLVTDAPSMGISGDHASSLLGLESGKLSHDALTNLQDGHDMLKSRLMASPLYTGILSKHSPEQQDVALEAAAMTIIALQGSSDYLQKTGATSVENGQLVQHHAYSLVSEPTSDLETALEGFDPASLETYGTHSVVANALATIQSGFEEAFFPIINVAPGSGGINVPVNIPRIYRPLTRNLDGTPDLLNRVNLIRAISDSSILASNALQVVPVSTGAATPAVLVDNAVVPTTQTVVDGVTVDTRPIKFDTTVGLLSLSTHAGFNNGDAYDETDQLEAILKMGDIWGSVTVDDGASPVAATFKMNVNSQPGTLLIQKVGGYDRDYIANSIVKFIVTDETPLVAGNASAFRDAMNASIGQPAGSKFRAVFKVRLSYAINTETANCTASYQEPELLAVYNMSGAAAVLESGFANTLLPLGYVPDARKTSSNLRTRSQIVDSRVVKLYRFTVQLHAPIISQHPVNSAVNTSVEGLAHTHRIRNNNNAHLTLLSAREMIRMENGAVDEPNSIGAEAVIPTYKYQELDVSSAVTTMNSKDALANLRGSLVAAVQNLIAHLVTESEYLAAMEFFYGNNTEWEAIIVTDPVIYQFIMEPGDPRAAGQGRNFRITQSLNKDFKGKIFISVRRLKRDGQIHPLDFGVFLYTPALSYSVQMTRNNRMASEIHTLPCNQHYVLCPILGEIDVLNLEEFYVTN